MNPTLKTRQALGAFIQMQLLSKAMKEAGYQMPVLRGFLSDTSTLDMGNPMQATGYKWTETILPYQVCSAILNQRHKRYMIGSTNILDMYTVTIEFSRFMSKVDSIDTSKGGAVKEGGGRLGKLDAATESGMFHKVNKSKLEQLKKTLKDAPIVEKKKSTPDPATKSESDE